MARAVRDVMMPEPLTIDAHTTLQDAALRMRHWDVDDVLVVDGDQFHGVLTLSNVVVTAIASGRHPGSITAGECCEPPEHTVSPGEPATHVARLMAQHQL